MSEFEVSREALRRKREEKRKIRRRKKIRKLLVSMTVFLALAGIYYTVYYTDFFSLEEILVEGNHELSPDEIISDSGLRKGENLLFINKKGIVDNINQIPYIKETVIKKKYPDGMAVSVVERTAEISLKTSNEIILLDFEGIPLEAVDEINEESMVVETDNIYECEMGRAVLFEENNISFDLIVDLMYYISLNEMVYVNKLKISGDDVYVLLDGGTLVKLDQDKDMKYQLVFSKNIIDERTDKNQDIDGLIDYTKGENPVYISSEDSEDRFEE
ncbi:POTRA domain-containing protein, FtsQ-type [Dethiosulfatibacter aminovorans DSM 17477]|uniref:POTRA domain-containing protein, FtsQ-type n=1 Tax=Dethiosulfatibacter aminovorans DSM 17477 TaxID=1121476 RepID=A0A1M6DL49_9FIRM|nr:FtsQ-type POTRA domain-containing protein [Dethiosulfatibacter aminovorans]SHI73881.1 POTRA domain-containing protein, FtsQ-type [Dethiosulfatibacter aminovorans DSM 17477]